MWYAIICQDVENSLPLRKIHRPAHIKRLEALNEQRRVLLAGPHPAEDSIEIGDAGFTGSLLVVDFDSIEDAKAWANQDPYMLNGIFESITVKPFMKILP